MACDMWQKKIDAYVDSELEPEETAKLDSHLRGCSACAADALRKVQLKRLTHIAGKRYTASAELRNRVLGQIAAQKPRRWTWFSAPQFALLALALLIAFVATDQRVRWRQREQALTELADLHVATLASANPLDVVSSDKHTVKPWFQGKIPFSFNLPDLQGSPFSLLGARMAYFEHAPGAELIYQYQQHRISVFVFKETTEFDQALGNGSLNRQLSFTLETWDAGGLRYVAVGDAEAENIGKLVALFKKAAVS